MLQPVRVIDRKSVPGRVQSRAALKVTLERERTVLVTDDYGWATDLFLNLREDAAEFLKNHVAPSTLAAVLRVLEVVCAEPE